MMISFLMADGLCDFSVKTLHTNGTGMIPSVFYFSVKTLHTNGTGMIPSVFGSAFDKKYINSK
jgi:hypothetical protein